MTITSLLVKWSKKFVADYKLGYQSTATGEVAKRKSLPPVTNEDKLAILTDLSTTENAMQFASTGDLGLLFSKDDPFREVADMSLRLDNVVVTWDRHCKQVTARASELAIAAGTEWPPKKEFQNFLTFVQSVQSPTVLEAELKAKRADLEAKGIKPSLELSLAKVYQTCAKSLIIAAIRGDLSVADGWETLASIGLENGVKFVEA